MRIWLCLFLVLSASAQSDLVLVCNYGNSTPLDGFFITIIDSDTNIATLVPLPNGRGPTLIVASPDGTKAYVDVRNSDHNPPANVSVVDLNLKQVIAVISEGIGVFPNVLTIKPDGTKVYSASIVSFDPTALGTVSVINTFTNTVSTIITVGNNPEAIGITPDGSKVFVANMGSDTISVIDTASDTVIATVPTGTGPQAIAVTPDSTQVYVTNYYGATVTAINTSSFATTTIHVGTNPNSLAVSPDGTKVYVTNSNSNSVSVINTSNNMIATTITGGLNTGVGEHPNAVAFAPDGVNAYVTTTLNGTTGAVAVIEVSSNTAVTLIGPPGIGTGPQSVAVIANSQTAYVANDNFNVLGIPGSVSAVNAATNTAFQITANMTTAPTYVIVAPNQWNLQGQSKRDAFIFQTDLYNEISWSIPVGASPTQYQIYRDPALTDLVTSLSPNTFSYQDHNRKKNTSYSYYLTYTDTLGNVHGLGNVTIYTSF